MGGYPPGTSRRDLIRGGIIEPHHHECEFEPVQTENPIIEDGAAIFFEKCIYAEGRYGDGWSCEEERSYRFEYDSLCTPSGERIDLPTISSWDEAPEDVAEQVIRIEEEFHSGNVEIDVHPDRDDGEVTLEWKGFILRYAP